MYSKNKIDHLFTEYIDTGGEAALVSFIEACESVIKVVVSRYYNYSRFRDDIVQDVKIKMWERFKDRERLSNYLENPSVYVFFKVRSYVALACANYKRLYGVGLEEPLENNSRIMSMVQGSYLDPDDAYILQEEFPRELLLRCKDNIDRCMECRGAPEKAEAALNQVKAMIAEDLGVVV